LSRSYYFVQPICGDLPCTSLWFFLFYSNVSFHIPISLKIMLLNCMILLFGSFHFFGTSCWKRPIFMTYFSHFSSSILTFICLFNTIEIPRIIATISRWFTIESCGPWFWNVGGHVAWRLEMIVSLTPIRKI